MGNGIKIDGFMLPHPQIQKAAPDSQKTAMPLKEDGIKVSEHLTHLIHLTMSEDCSVDENQRVKEMKQRIDSNSYKVDLDKLSEKLMNHMFYKAIGE